MGEKKVNTNQDKLTNIKGEVRGFMIKNWLDFIIKEKGEEGLKRIEEELIKLGYPIKYKDIKRFSFYPLRLNFLIIDIIDKFFNFTDKKYQELGHFHRKSLISPGVKTLIYFFSTKFPDKAKLIEEIPKQWKKGATVGSIEVIEFDERKRHIILRIKDYLYHPVECKTTKGFLLGFTERLKTSNSICEETKCVHRGDAYHEFILKW